MTDRLALAIVHYHLHTGGVTTVVRHACEALREAEADVAVLTGEPVEDESAWDVPVRVVHGLGYDEGDDAADPSRLADALFDAARDALGRAPDLFHVHNHNLGKNVALPAALRALADAVRPLLLQMHDFAEDGRPRNYRRTLKHMSRAGIAPGETLYPTATHVHLAVLNGRDHAWLRDAGCDEHRLHLLPNAVTAPAVEVEAKPPARAGDEGRLFIYPTRAIPRKNLGELLLWAAACPQDRFAVTMAPKNPRYHAGYQHWVSLAARLGLPVTFELGRRSGLPFGALLQTADALITTSVAEGFGLVYLEPWLVGRPLVGRRLPLICRDLEARGIQLGGLYDRAAAPVDWLDAAALEQRVRERMADTCRAYGRSCDDDAVRRALGSMIEADRVDVGRLDAPLQRVIIERLADSPAARRELRPPGLSIDEDISRAAIVHNRRMARDAFGLPRYRQRLMEVYAAVRRDPPGPIQPLDPDAVLDQFLRPEAFNLLLT